MQALIIFLLIGLLASAAGASVKPENGLTFMVGVVSFVLGLFIARDFTAALGIGMAGAVATVIWLAWLNRPLSRRHHRP